MGNRMSEKIYIKIKQQNSVEEPVAYISDVAGIYCENNQLKKKIEELELAHFETGIYETKVYDALNVVEIIRNEVPDADIECLGDSDFIVQYKKHGSKNAGHWIKVFFVCIITMIGSGYGIIAYNNDVSTTDIFDRIYGLFGASSYESSNIMEVAYAIGLFVGIVVFYDHFAGHKLSKAPTPLEVEMDKYNKDVADSVIDRKYEGKEQVGK